MVRKVMVVVVPVVLVVVVVVVVVAAVVIVVLVQWYGIQGTGTISWAVDTRHGNIYL